MDRIKDIIQEQIDAYLRGGSVPSLNPKINNQKELLDLYKNRVMHSTHIYCRVESLGTIIGRTQYPYSLRFNLNASVPMTIRELAEVDLNSSGWRLYGPLHKRGNSKCNIGLECNENNVQIKTKQAYLEFVQWIRDSHININIKTQWDDEYVTEQETKGRNSWR